MAKRSTSGKLFTEPPDPKKRTYYYGPCGEDEQETTHDPQPANQSGTKGKHRDLPFDN